MKLHKLGKYGDTKKEKVIPKNFVKTGTLSKGTKILICFADTTPEEELILDKDTDIYHNTINGQVIYDDLTDDSWFILSDGSNIYSINNEPWEEDIEVLKEWDPEETGESLKIDQKYLDGTWRILFHN
jgi:hypothetical protein